MKPPPALIADSAPRVGLWFLRSITGRIVLVGLVLVTAIMAGLWLRNAKARRDAFTVLEALEPLLSGVNQTIPETLVVFPKVLRDKSPAEGSQWLRDVLRDELSPEGIAALREHARFGKLGDLFPEHADTWAKAAGAAPDECLAFRMDRDGVTAEVVLVPGPGGLRISRCNNVKQMAQLPGS